MQMDGTFMSGDEETGNEPRVQGLIFPFAGVGGGAVATTA